MRGFDWPGFAVASSVIWDWWPACTSAYNLLYCDCGSQPRHGLCCLSPLLLCQEEAPLQAASRQAYHPLWTAFLTADRGPLRVSAMLKAYFFVHVLVLGHIV